MSHPDPLACDAVADLLGVYALDALDPEEADLVRDHLQLCPRCAQEVDEHRESIVMLAGGGGPAPEQLWERIASSIGADAGPSSAPPPPRLAAAARRRPRRAKPIWAAAAAAAAAFAAVVGLQTARVDQLNHRVNQLATAARQTGGFQGLAAALVDPSARHYTLTSTGSAHQPLGQLIILPSGASYLVGSRLSQLASDRTYQLWSMVDGRAVSVGLLGAHPNTAAFTVDPSVSAAAYLVTVEPAGGVVTPTTAPIAQAAT
jgi:hypothetical protein